MLFGTNINGASKSELCEKQHLFYESSPKRINANTASKKHTPRAASGVSKAVWKGKTKAAFSRDLTASNHYEG